MLRAIWPDAIVFTGAETAKAASPVISMASLQKGVTYTLEFAVSMLIHVRASQIPA